MTLHDQRIHAAGLLRKVATLLYEGKACVAYMPSLREATTTVAHIAEAEVVIASTARDRAREVAG
jgi:hypothetical protein